MGKRPLQSIIDDVAREIAKGNTCYIHRYTVEVTIIDDSIEDDELIAAQKVVQAELERKIDNHVKIEKLTAVERMVIMKDFLEELPDKSIRKQLSNALNRKNPIRNFTKAVESDIELSVHWDNFNFEEYQRWVSNVIIDAHNE